MPKNINFIDLNEKEIHLVLSWRNTPHIKKWMHTQEDITLTDHLNFIETLKHNKSKDYFLVKQDNIYLGVIDLNGNFLGIYANPDLKKVGDILLKQIINFAFSTKKLPVLKAEVYKTNTPAIKLYTRFEFKTIKENEKMLTMELSYENR
ncbi:UDP-4-amino-4,6-dideoxy-N-acetyl-beta-L-altrosamine N-acetyltransferase [Sulfurospirillum arcachonense]|uniref:UDP-4-amino-4, 6-dideoxy-N-acetyl-beta-L-altrosamine N-acetyltransferase n=1 Tax=Sulfurospirillum arcachonense TaxID=57666 RepID=UPI000468C872|nr:UDP-4-amino-4,6-dideoxy-N-acetyl-beta-L-altrosamine N-acetyltransferase [Sulfurospirillum arcachonense]